jgi:hypothetical protein
MTDEKFESALDNLVRWGLVKVEINENGDEVYSSTGLRIEDLELCEECGLPLQTSKQ